MAEQKKPWEPEASFRFIGAVEHNPEGGALIVAEHDGGLGVEFRIEPVGCSVVLMWQQIDALRELIGDRYGAGKLRRAEEP